MLNKTERKALIRTVEKYRARVAKVRDDLRAAIEDLEGLLESCERAEENLQCATDALSELA